MDKVIVERPRIGSRLPSRKKGYRKYIQQSSIEYLPKHEPMLGRWKGRQRSLNEHLGPMRRFLRSNIGRPWNKVHSELCEHVSFDNAVQAHVLSHVYDYVSKNVVLQDKKVIAIREWGYRYELRPGNMYVCPKTGLLREVKQNKRRMPARKAQFDSTSIYLKRDHNWWEVKVCKLPDHPGEQWDVWLEQDVVTLSKSQCDATYGGRFFAASKRPLTKVEAKWLQKQIRHSGKRRGKKRN